MDRAMTVAHAMSSRSNFTSGGQECPHYPAAFDFFTCLNLKMMELAQ
jgi:hypothetical protein